MTQAVAGVVSPWPGAGHLTSSARPRVQPRSGLRGDRADRERRLLGALANAERAAVLLCPDGWSDPDDPDVAVTAEKAAAETALLALMST